MPYCHNRDDFAPLAAHHDVRVLMIWMEGKLNEFLVTVLLGQAVIAGIALVIARLT